MYTARPGFRPLLHRSIHSSKSQARLIPLLRFGQQQQHHYYRNKQHSGSPKLPTNHRALSTMTSTSINSTQDSSGHTAPVWLSTEPFSHRPHFPQLSQNLTNIDLLIVGAGIAGIQTAYEAVQAGLKVCLIDAREALSGETGRTSGHLASFLDDRFYELIKTYGKEGARTAYDSHQWALERVGEVARKEGIECEYRTLDGVLIVSVPDTDPEYVTKNDLPQEAKALETLGIPYRFQEKGKVGELYTGAVLTMMGQATFHPTKYLHGLLKVLKEKHSDQFQAYTNTRMRSYHDHGTHTTIETEGGHTITASSLLQATNVPLHMGSIILKEGFYRTYCIAQSAPNTIPDILLYDNADPYIYTRKTTHPDPTKCYLITGGEDHKVGQESASNYPTHFQHLAKWAKSNFPDVDETPDFAWSGQIVEPNDGLAFIGRNTGTEKNVFVVTGDSGNGLTHGVIASRIIPDLITNTKNPWIELYSPARKPKPRTITEDVKENVKQNMAYKRWINPDPQVHDIEDIPRGCGAVLGGVVGLGKPVAVYRGEDGEARRFSAVCPHMAGVVAWNKVEGTWDCPVHGSRFDGKTGKCVMGPSNRGLAPEDEMAKQAVKAETSG
ncbi:DAO-domain-containing protein [Ascodesmis nigricans]|uniref:DAO-domain-containing protein n=1 Tax=Ascodesmis nigricans TaxID=341454 RepID=A0A4S2MHL2_9PEZI|nr:DAO-domain-containing protein [Ascodesmis nigricans]